MRNSSQNAGCMRRSPASHCCQVRQVVCTSTPAAVWDSPAASRAARTSAGAGLDSGPFGPRFGWLDMRATHVDDVVAVVVLVDDLEISAAALTKSAATSAAAHAAKSIANAASGGLANHVIALVTAFGDFDRADIGFGVVEFVGEGDGLGHFLLQPLLPRGAVGKQCASHELNYTRIARKGKNFLKLFFGGLGETGKPSNDQGNGQDATTGDAKEKAHD